MGSVYRYLPRRQRQQDQAAYLAYLRERDGEPSLHPRSLSRREAYFRDIDARPIRYRGPVPRQEFLALYDGAAPGDEHTAKALWMAVVSQASEGEQYGISIQLDSYGRQGADGGSPLIYSELEEVYHTRIFEDIMRTLGLELKVRKPRGLMRFFVWATAALPKPISAPLVFLFEIIGVVGFRRLRALVPQLFSDDPPAAQRILSLLDEVMVDEIGHVSYVRSQLGPVRLLLARCFMWIMAPAVLALNPALRQLFDGRELRRDAIHFDWDQIPEDLRERAFLPSDAGTVAPPGALPAQA